jgi:hypothetical protein
VTEHDPTLYRLSLHGLAVEVSSASDALDHELARFCQPFTVAGWPPGVMPARGLIRPYHQSDVSRHLSAKARRINGVDEPIDLYEDGERFWVIDDRFGLCEINLLKNQWRTWLLPQARLDPVRCAEFAVIWPMAQLLRSRGLHLLPAAAVTRGGRGVLILSETGIEAELANLLNAGYRIIGQRWTAVREEDGRIDLLHLPGRVQRPVPPRLQAAFDQSTHQGADQSDWIDLADGRSGAEQNHAFCDAVLLIQRGRRSISAFSRLTDDPLGALRAAWPIVQLRPQRRPSPLPAQLARQCSCWQARLSHDAADLLHIIPAMLADPAATRQPRFTAPAMRAA